MKVLADPVAAWSEAKPINQAVFDRIDGRFAGNILLDDPHRGPLDLEMELSNASLVNGQLIGEFVLKTTDPSNLKYRDTTRSNANSKIRNFRISGDGALPIEGMGGDGIYQLYYSAGSNSFHGSLYEKQGLEKFKRTGTVTLSHR